VLLRFEIQRRWSKKSKAFGQQTHFDRLCLPCESEPVILSWPAPNWSSGRMAFANLYWGCVQQQLQSSGMILFSFSVFFLTFFSASTNLQTFTYWRDSGNTRIDLMYH
jgi:hypothetical protein